MPAGKIFLRCTNACASWVGTATKTHVNTQTGRRPYTSSQQRFFLFILAVAVTLLCRYLIKNWDGVLPMRDANIREGEVFIFLRWFVFSSFVFWITTAITWLLVIIVLLENFLGTQVMEMHRPGHRGIWTPESITFLFQVDIQLIVCVCDVNCYIRGITEIKLY